MKKSSKEQHNPSDGNQVDNKPTKAFTWSWIYGAIGGAAVVGIVWIGMSTLHSSNPVEAKVGNTAIRQSQLDTKLEASSGSQLLEQLVAYQLIEDGAKKANVTASQKEVQSEEQTIEAQNGITSASQLSQLLAQNGMTQSDFNQMAKVQVLEQKLSEQGIKVTSQEIQAYYNAHKSSFVPSGSKKPQPLSAVKSQITSAIKQSKATPSTQLIANLAKQEGITIYNSQFADVKTQLEGSTATTTGNSTSANTTSGAASASNSTSSSASSSASGSTSSSSSNNTTGN